MHASPPPIVKLKQRPLPDHTGQSRRCGVSHSCDLRGHGRTCGSTFSFIPPAGCPAPAHCFHSQYCRESQRQSDITHWYCCYPAVVKLNKYVRGFFILFTAIICTHKTPLASLLQNVCVLRWLWLFFKFQVIYLQVFCWMKWSHLKVAVVNRRLF